VSNVVKLNAQHSLKSAHLWEFLDILPDFGAGEAGGITFRAHLEVGDERFHSSEIQRQYEAEDSPLRKPGTRVPVRGSPRD
jgi:hypothetical protein